MSNPESLMTNGGASNLSEVAEAMTAGACDLAFGGECRVTMGQEGYCRVLGWGAVSECADSCKVGAEV